MADGGASSCGKGGFVERCKGAGHGQMLKGRTLGMAPAFSRFVPRRVLVYYSASDGVFFHWVRAVLTVHTCDSIADHACLQISHRC